MIPSSFSSFADFSRLEYIFPISTFRSTFGSVGSVEVVSLEESSDDECIWLLFLDYISKESFLSLLLVSTGLLSP